jgi:hypothetical protein
MAEQSTTTSNTKIFGVDVPTFDVPGIDADKLVEALRDAAYLTVGIGVLAFQKAQQVRKDVTDGLSNRFGSTNAQVDELKARIEQYFADLDERVSGLEGRIDQAVESLEDKLPEQAGQLLNQAHDRARSARKQVRDLVRRAA